MIAKEQIDYWAEEVQCVKPQSVRAYIENIVRAVEQDVATDVNGYIFDRNHRRIFGTSQIRGEMDLSQQQEK